MMKPRKSTYCLLLLSAWTSCCFAQPQYKWQNEAPIANFAWDENDTTRYTNHYLFEHAYSTIESMLTDKRPLDFAEAVFAVENCMYDGTLDHKWYEAELQRISKELSRSN